MIENPVFIRMPTENDQPFFKNRSASEAIISTVIAAQMKGWLKLHGFVVLPLSLEMVLTPLKQGVAGIVAHLQAETIPLVNALIPDAGAVWGRRYMALPLTTQGALDAQLQMLLLSPIAHNIAKIASEYPYSSANTRYMTTVSTYLGFKRKLERITDTDEIETVRIPVSDYDDEEENAKPPSELRR